MHDYDMHTGLDHPNNGKASILRETGRLVVELLSQVDSLKKENETLLSESNYVSSLLQLWTWNADLIHLYVHVSLEAIAKSSLS